MPWRSAAARSRRWSSWSRPDRSVAPRSWSARPRSVWSVGPGADHQRPCGQSVVCDADRQQARRRRDSRAARVCQGHAGRERGDNAPPSLSLIYAHVNRIIRQHDLDVIYLAGSWTSRPSNGSVGGGRCAPARSDPSPSQEPGLDALCEQQVTRECRGQNWPVRRSARLRRQRAHPRRGLHRAPRRVIGPAARSRARPRHRRRQQRRAHRCGDRIDDGERTARPVVRDARDALHPPRGPRDPSALSSEVGRS